MFRSGRRLFSTAALLMLITAGLHTFGFFGPRQHSQEEVAAYSAMENLTLHKGDAHPSFGDVYFSLAMAMSVTFMAIGVLNLVLASSNEVSDNLLKRIGWVNFLWVTAFCIESFHYQVPPPLISGIVIDVFILAGLLLPSPKSS